MRYEYRRLGDFTYHVLENPEAIRAVMTRWIVPEMEADHEEDPNQPWTVEWLEQIPSLTFRLAVLPLADIHPRTDLMSYETAHYSFRNSLERRVSEREQAMLRGVSIEPLWLKSPNSELMDGYTRYTVLKRHRQALVYAYVGTVPLMAVSPPARAARRRHT